MKLDSLTPNKRLVIQIVTFNSAASIVPALQSVLQQTAAGWTIEIRILDNASSDQTFQLVSDHFPTQFLEQSSVNLGFSGGHNQLLSSTLKNDCQAVFILNPDVIIPEGALAKLLLALELDPSAGLLTPKLLRTDRELLPKSPPEIDAAGMYMTREIRHFDRGSGELDSGQYNLAQYVFGGTGAALLIRRTCLEDLAWRFPDHQGIELFDEAFFAYREDADLAWRALRAGWRCRYEPSSVMYHQRVVTPERRKSLAPELNRYSVRNRFLLQLNNWSCCANLWSLPHLVFRNLLVIAGVLFTETSSVPALTDVFRLAPRALDRRKRIFASARLSAGAMARWFARSPVTEPALSLSPHKRSIDRLVIAIINYRSGARLKLCIEKALAAVKELESSLVCQTIVVDNSPDATDLASLMGHFPNEAGLVILHDGQNLGFAGGVERALEGRDWDGVLILNPDVALTGEALKNMLQAVISNQELAAVGATLLNSDFTPQHGFIARRFPTLASTLMEFFFLHKIFPLNRYTAAYLLRDEPRFREYVDCKYSQYPGVPVSALPYLVEQPAGACLMVARDAYQAVGGFDLDFWPAWFEDVDLAKRLRSAGYQLAVCANARVLHEGGYSKESIGDTAFARIWYKNLLRYWKKHGSFIEYSLIRGSLVPALLLRALYSRAHLHVLLDLFSRNDPNS